MKWFRVFSISLFLIFSLACDRSPAPPTQVNLHISMGAPAGVPQSVTLPGAFSCIILGVHQSSDTDGSHCFTNPSGQIDMTSMHGPLFAQSTSVSLTLPAETVTFSIWAISSSSICSSLQSTGLSVSTMLSAPTFLLLTQSAALSSGVNNVALSPPTSSSEQMSGGGCSDVTNVN